VQLCNLKRETNWKCSSPSRPAVDAVISPKIAESLDDSENDNGCRKNYSALLKIVRGGLMQISDGINMLATFYMEQG
jgi:hypothetical protein